MGQKQKFELYFPYTIIAHILLFNESVEIKKGFFLSFFVFTMLSWNEKERKWDRKRDDISFFFSERDGERGGEREQEIDYASFFFSTHLSGQLYVLE